MDNGQDVAMEERLQPRWTRLAAVGLLFAGLGPLLLLIASLVWGLDVAANAAFFGVAIAVAFLGAFVVWRAGRTWALWVGIAAAILLLGALFWTAFSITAVTSFFDFVPAILVVPGALLALVSCIAALVAKRRGHRSARAEGGERTGLRIAVGLVAGLTLVSGILTLTSRSTEGSASEADAQASMKDFEFVPKTYSAAGGSKVFVANDDPFQHTFTVEGLGIDEHFGPGTSRLIDIPSQPGTYVLYCKYHTSDPDHPSKDDMAGTLVVT